jgi:hypothetical protein
MTYVIVLPSSISHHVPAAPVSLERTMNAMKVKVSSRPYDPPPATISSHIIICLSSLPLQ